MDPTKLTGFLEAQLPTALDLLRQMVEINSWTENRAGVNRVGQFTADAFAPLGFASERVPSVNPNWGDHLILTRNGSSGRSLALISHLDTVFPPEEEARNNFRWQPEGDRIYGPGTHDIKGGTVMMWLVLSALKTLDPVLFNSLNWKLFWNSSEEQLSADFGDICRARLSTDTLAALVFEAEGKLPGGRRLVVARKGRGTWRIRVRGRGAHAGVKHAQGANAVVQLAHTIERVAALTDHDRQLTFNVGLIRGGTGLNRVPHEAEARGEFRAFTPEAYRLGKAGLLALAGLGEVKSATDGFPCRVEVEILDENSPWAPNRGTESLLAHWQAAGAELGQRVEGESRGGLSDGNHLWEYVPTLDGLGPAGDNDHCSERSADGTKIPEFTEASSFVPKAVLNAWAICRLFKAIATH
jgi:glutamate carboxypeptidase